MNSLLYRYLYIIINIFLFVISFSIPQVLFLVNFLFIRIVKLYLVYIPEELLQAESYLYSFARDNFFIYFGLNLSPYPFLTPILYIVYS